MFWQKRVKRLQADLEITDKLREKYWESYVGAAEQRKQALQELAAAVNQNRDYEARIETLEYALSESKGLNQALEDENKDLGRQLELLQALLGQLRVNVTLPARKK
jgi:chromosome segregation ATPase